MLFHSWRAYNGFFLFLSGEEVSVQLVQLPVCRVFPGKLPVFTLSVLNTLKVFSRYSTAGGNMYVYQG